MDGVHGDPRRASVFRRGGPVDRVKKEKRTLAQRFPTFRFERLPVAVTGVSGDIKGNVGTRHEALDVGQRVDTLEPGAPDHAHRAQIPEGLGRRRSVERGDDPDIPVL